MILSYRHEPRLRLGFGPSSLSRLVHASHVVTCIGTPLFMVGGWSLSAPPERWFVETSRDECAIYVVQIRLLGVSRVNGRGAGTELGPRDRDLGLPVRDVVCSDMIGRHRSITQHHLAKRTSTVTPTVALLLGSTLLCLCTHRALTCNTFRLHTTVDENHEIVPRRRDLSNSKALEQQLGVVAEWLTRLTRMVCPLAGVLKSTSFGSAWTNPWAKPVGRIQPGRGLWEEVGAGL